MLHKGLLGDERIRRIGSESDAVRHAEHVCINRHRSFPEDDREYHIGSLTTHAGQLHQRVHIGRDLTAMQIDEGICHAQQRAGLVVGKRNTLDILKDILDRGICHIGRGGISRKECGSDHIDALVGALCREYHSHKQLKGVTVVQLRLGNRAVFAKPPYHACVSLLYRHLSSAYYVNVKKKLIGFCQCSIQPIILSPRKIPPKAAANPSTRLPSE